MLRLQRISQRVSQGTVLSAKHAIHVASARALLEQHDVYGMSVCRTIYIADWLRRQSRMTRSSLVEVGDTYNPAVHSPLTDCDAF